WRVAVGAAMAAACTCGLIALMVSRMGDLLASRENQGSLLSRTNVVQLRFVSGLVAGAAIGFDQEIWRCSITDGVWSLTMLFFLLAITLFWRWIYSPEKKRYLCAAFVFYGLTVGNSEAMMVAWPGLAVLLVLNRENFFADWRAIVLSSFCFIVVIS